MNIFIVLYYQSHAVVRLIHGLRKSKLGAFQAAQSIDCRTKCGSMLCTAEFMDCTNLCFAPNIYMDCIVAKITVFVFFLLCSAAARTLGVLGVSA